MYISCSELKKHINPNFLKVILNAYWMDVMWNWDNFKIWYLVVYDDKEITKCYDNYKNILNHEIPKKFKMQYIILAHEFKFKIINELSDLNPEITKLMKYYENKENDYRKIKIKKNIPLKLEHYMDFIETDFLSIYREGDIRQQYTLDEYLNYMKPKIFTFKNKIPRHYYLDEDYKLDFENSLVILSCGCEHFIVDNQNHLNEILDYMNKYCQNVDDIWLIDYVRD